MSDGLYSGNNNSVGSPDIAPLYCAVGDSKTYHGSESERWRSRELLLAATHYGSTSPVSLAVIKTASKTFIATECLISTTYETLCT